MTKLVLRINCGDSNPPVLVVNLPFLENIFGLPFSLNILLVFETLSRERKIRFSLWGNALECLDFVQGLHSFVACSRGARFLRRSYVYSLRMSKEKLRYFPLTVISKCRKWHLRGTYLKFFPGAACPQTPLEAQACRDHEHSYIGSKTSFFSWQGWNLWNWQYS